MNLDSLSRGYAFEKHSSKTCRRRSIFFRSRCVNCRCIKFVDCVNRDMSLPSPAITSSESFVSHKWSTTFLNANYTPALVFFFQYSGFTESLAISAATAVDFVEYGTSLIAAPFLFALQLHCILNVEKEPLADMGSNASRSCNLICICSRPAHFWNSFVTFSSDNLKLLRKTESMVSELCLVSVTNWNEDFQFFVLVLLLLLVSTALPGSCRWLPQVAPSCLSRFIRVFIKLVLLTSSTYFFCNFCPL